MLVTSGGFPTRVFAAVDAVVSVFALLNVGVACGVTFVGVFAAATLTGGFTALGKDDEALFVLGCSSGAFAVFASGRGPSSTTITLFFGKCVPRFSATSALCIVF